MLFNFICIEGNIGVGKTTLVKKLAAHFNAVSFFEEFNENPWLPLFYQNPKDTALALELSFLTDRCKQLLQIEKDNTSKIISDYCLDKCLLFTEANLSIEDFTTYKKLFDRISATIKKPDLVVVLHTSVDTLQRNIIQRGRSYEQSIQPAYLETLNNSYLHFFSEEKEYTVLNIISEKINEDVYENIFNHIITFTKQTTQAKINTIKL
ncbi:MAG: deoxynucleoside kinase [Bacteroidia bacterium]